jgi:cell division protein FtsI/penicillin-binding protein 2
MQKRLVVLFLMVMTAFVLLAFRLILIQRDNGRSYTMQVLSQQAYENKSLPYKRGKITDIKGTVLADSQLVYNVIVDASQMLEKEEYLEPSLNALTRLGIDKEEIRAYIMAHPGSQYYIARKNLPYQDKQNFDKQNAEGIEAEKAERQALKEKAEKEGKDADAIEYPPLEYSNIKGIWFEDSYIRTYPGGPLAADVIGFTVGDNIGTYGLEEYYNDTLNGIPGRTYGYVDQSLNQEQTTIEPTDGNNLVLTLDANIQSICEKYLKEFNEELKDNKHKGNGTNNAACIIMDVNTGGILAMASEPGFDLNDPYNIAAVAGMPKLEAMILSSAYISDLSAFANCKNLKMLEIAFCGMVTDISPLAGCEKLEMLNISFTGVTDISPLDNLPLTHLCALNYSNKRVSKEGQDRFQQLHPECWTQYVGEQPYGPGWRYTEDGKDYLPYYQMLRDIFRYEIFPRTPNHVGWYLSEELIEKYGL